MFQKKSIKIPFVKNFVYKQYTSDEIADILYQKIQEIQEKEYKYQEKI